MSYKIAIIGAKEAIIGFKAIGFETIACQDVHETIKIITQLKRDTLSVDDEHKNQYAIIFVTEDLAKEIPLEEYRKFANYPLPAVIAIPSHKGATGFGITRLRRIVERAVGSDILK